MTEAWFAATRDLLEAHYLPHPEPWRQSGMSGPKLRWDALRKPVADAIDRSGALLDIGCANGYLLECCQAWTNARGIALELHGLDLSGRLVALARERLPAQAANLHVGNAATWQPPRRYDFVRTELVYVPAEHEGAYVRDLLERYLAPGGALLVTNYAEGHPNPAATVAPGSHGTANLAARLAELGFAPERFVDGLDPVKGRRTRVAVLRPGSGGPGA